ncbi:MAG TPA: dihydropteroate synthase [Rhodospirillaceae bacterium]|jgi:dihydropteroate synthase|nr:dihydropteroate synthase [Alphaproteobacteria bacterium]HBH25913.1 dihydropteroate synthase [Rhodospirillaceae bacterium]
MHLLDALSDPCPLLMGIVNATPDSFADGGAYDPVAQGQRLAREGAAILDIGGESTRPGSAPVAPEEECARVLPVIRALARAAPLISVDTRHAATMAAALASGANMVNDIRALADTGAMEVLAARTDVLVCLMHMRGEPATMQDAPAYADVVGEVCAFLGDRAAACEAAGIARTRLILDPGIGFGKTVAHNLELLRSIDRLKGLGLPVLIGASRKSLIAALSSGEPPAQRLPGSLALALAAARAGADVLRVHDVAATAQALAVGRALA